MLDQLLHYFPPHTYPLILVSDPDAVLADSQIVAALHERTFRVITEADPIALRYQVEQARPWSIAAPLIIVTPEPVNTLPYDLWQQGHHVELVLHELFPIWPIACSSSSRRASAAVLPKPRSTATNLHSRSPRVKPKTTCSKLSLIGAPALPCSRPV